MNASLIFAQTVDCLVHAELSELTGSDFMDVAPDTRSDAADPNSTRLPVPDPFELDKARLYVMPVADDSAKAHVDCDIVLLDEDENPYRLLRRTRHHPPIVAGCLVATGWCAPFGLDDEVNARPPSEHPLRQRVRLTVAVTDAGIASVLRQSDQPDVVHSLPDRGMGDLPDVLDAWWRQS